MEHGKTGRRARGTQGRGRRRSRLGDTRLREQSYDSRGRKRSKLTLTRFDFPLSTFKKCWGFSLAYSSLGSLELSYRPSSVSTFFKLKDNLLLKIAQFLFFLSGGQSVSFIFLIAEIFLFD